MTDIKNPLTVVPGKSKTWFSLHGETVRVLHSPDGTRVNTMSLGYVPTYRLDEVCAMLGLDEADSQVLEAMVLVFDRVEISHMEAPECIAVRVS